MAEMIETNKTDHLPCGHPRGCLIQDAKGTPRCAWCEEVARLREKLAKQIQRRRIEVAAVLHARNEAEHKTFEWYEECQSEVERLRMLLEQDGAAYLPCQHCGKNVATPTLESIELCFECWERLRELIPDTGLLRRLADYARYDFTNQPPAFADVREQLHADATAAVALADRIEEANVDREQQ